MLYTDFFMIVVAIVTLQSHDPHRYLAWVCIGVYVLHRLLQKFRRKK